ncbi:GP46-like surface antigen, putative [Bodo saltans]|uniref:protein-tyrosine-phosphatase n=1 Tax=Bodo saltans TaxID=75058 RepID=A0A0S4J7G3_BODSA|nr:GP46-like surface antigen, putative [Bodo saltans]|eukprot:CUG86236.1 GP46-like surface antigen, putative [Bodo saltans]
MQAVGPQDNATVVGKQTNNIQTGGGNPLTSTSHNNHQQQKTDVSTNGTHLPTDDSEEGCGQTVTNTVSGKTTNGIAGLAGGQPINNGSFADSQKDENRRVVTTTGSTYSARPEDHRAEQMRNAGSFAGGPENSNNNNNPAHGIIVQVEIPTDAQHSHEGDHDEDFGGSDEDDLLEDSALRPGKDYVATMSEFAVGESVGDKYEVMEVLKCGTVGRTYRARSTAHDAQCVFKVVCFLSREELVESVRDAQKVLTRLQHANVLPVFDVMEDANHENMIIVTSYVPNRNVSRHCGLLLPGAGGGGTHEIEHLRMMLRDIGVGIRVLHSHHVYHHNIKLENILETKDGGCCVADAGYSSLFSSQPLEVLLDLQNGGLIPPEYFLEDYDLTQASAAARIDTWSFGWVMYELAYGAPPYEITNDMSVEDVRRLVISHKLKCPIETTNAPNDLWEVIKWSLEKKPKDRPTVMKLLRHQFFRIANGQSFVEPGNSSSFAAGSMMHVHKSLTVEHTGFVMSVVLGKGPHAENFLVHMPNMPNKVFVLKCFSDSLASRMQHLETPQIFSLRKHLAITRKIRHPTIAHTYEIVDNEENTYATQRYFARGNLAINFPALEQGGLVIRMIADPAARAAGGGARSSFRGKHNNRRDMLDSALKSGGDGPALSRAGSMSIGQLSNTANGHRGARHNPSCDDPMDDDDDVVERGGDDSVAGAAPAPKKGLLQEHEANEDTNPLTEIELCRQNNESELMLHNFGLVMSLRRCLTPRIHLNLSNNSLVELPHDVSFLHNLQRLSLANNKLESLPDSVGDLGELQYLDVSHNALEDLPQSLMFADKLETIAMDYNNCSEIPGVILDMPQMRIIYLAENRKINKWPPVSQLVAIGPMKLGLDNEPLLWKEFHEIQHQLQSRVTVMWNKIYPDEIIPHLFCGSLRSAQSLAVYDRLNITFLLTVGRGLEPTVIPDMHHKVVIVDDIEGATIDHSFQDAVSFIDDALKSQQGCLVHCFAGMSRSATTVIAYLMIRKGMRLDEAYCTTRRGRPAIYPNGGFFAQLLALDAKLYPGGRPLDMPSMERHIIPST